MKPPLPEIASIIVRREEIETMYDRFDSGMADITTTNAVALAIKRIVGPDRTVRVCRNEKMGTCSCLIGTLEIPLSGKVYQWLDSVESGKKPEPFSFVLRLSSQSDRTPDKRPSQPGNQTDMEYVA